MPFTRRLRSSMKSCSTFPSTSSSKSGHGSSGNLSKSNLGSVEESQKKALPSGDCQKGKKKFSSDDCESKETDSVAPPAKRSKKTVTRARNGPGGPDRPTKIASESGTSDTKNMNGKARKHEEVLSEGKSCEGKPVLTKEAKKVIQAINGSRKYLGVHVSAEGGIHNAVANAAAIGCRSFALFLRNQRTWHAKPLDQAVAEKFRKALKDYGYSDDMVVPHGSYLLNAGSPDPEKLQKTRETLLDEVLRCRTLGIKMYNFHPVIETMASQGNTIGGTFEELKRIIDVVLDKSRVGVCLDTCHIFAAGFDISHEKGYESAMKKFGETVGFEYLKALHLNDSKGECGSHLDRHENIGKGKIGKSGFECLMKDPRLDGIPMILETPEGSYHSEMITLYNLEKP